jgi:hypothetical protein
MDLEDQNIKNLTNKLLEDPEYTSWQENTNKFYNILDSLEDQMKNFLTVKPEILESINTILKKKSETINEDFKGASKDEKIKLIAGQASFLITDFFHNIKHDVIHEGTSGFITEQRLIDNMETIIREITELGSTQYSRFKKNIDIILAESDRKEKEIKDEIEQKHTEIENKETLLSTLNSKPKSISRRFGLETNASKQINETNIYLKRAKDELKMSQKELSRIVIRKQCATLLIYIITLLTDLDREHFGGKMHKRTKKRGTNKKTKKRHSNKKKRKTHRR